MISLHVRFSSVEHPRVLFNENLGQISFYTILYKNIRGHGYENMKIGILCQEIN